MRINEVVKEPDFRHTPFLLKSDLSPTCNFISVSHADSGKVICSDASPSDDLHALSSEYIDRLDSLLVTAISHHVKPIEENLDLDSSHRPCHN